LSDIEAECVFSGDNRKTKRVLSAHVIALTIFRECETKGMGYLHVGH